MKIISKYSDFYDQFGYAFGSHDESLVYVRKEEPFSPEKTTSRTLGRYMFSSVGFQNADRSCFSVAYETVLVGIYPTVYISPVAVISNRVANVEIPVNIMKSDIKDGGENLNKRIHERFDEYVKKEAIEGGYLQKEEFSRKNFSWRIGRSLLYDLFGETWKVENQDLFFEIGAPVFIAIDDRKYNVIHNLLPSFNGHSVLKNPTIVRMPFSVFGEHEAEILNDINIYTRIENYLWSAKTTEEPNPNNETRILNAGFDLKTSFRKDKQKK